MRADKHHETPARLLRLKQRFADWRNSRQRGRRIPQPLWKAAAKLAGGLWTESDRQRIEPRLLCTQETRCPTLGFDR